MDRGLPNSQCNQVSQQSQRTQTGSQLSGRVTDTPNKMGSHGGHVGPARGDSQPKPQQDATLSLILARLALPTTVSTTLHIVEAQNHAWAYKGRGGVHWTLCRRGQYLDGTTSTVAVGRVIHGSYKYAEALSRYVNKVQQRRKGQRYCVASAVVKAVPKAAQDNLQDALSNCSLAEDQGKDVAAQTLNTDLNTKSAAAPGDLKVTSQSPVAAADVLVSSQCESFSVLPLPHAPCPPALSSLRPEVYHEGLVIRCEYCLNAR